MLPSSTMASEPKRIVMREIGGKKNLEELSWLDRFAVWITMSGRSLFIGAHWPDGAPAAWRRPARADPTRASGRQLRVRICAQSSLPSRMAAARHRQDLASPDCAHMP